MEKLSKLLERQIKAVETRVHNGGNVYIEEITEVKIAADNVVSLKEKLGLGDFVRSITPPTGKPQYLLAFKKSPVSTEEVVLKVYGSVRPGEGYTQKTLTDKGASVVPTLAFGNEPVSWLLMEYVSGRDLSSVIEEGGPLELIKRTTEVAKAMSTYHRDAPTDYPEVQSLESAIFRHLANVMKPLVAHGYRVPSTWETQAKVAYNSGANTGLHNDLFGGNVFVADDGRTLILDSAADYCVGDPTFDAARWIVRGITDLDPKDMLQGLRSLTNAWLQGQPDLDRELLSQMISTELLMQAGVVEIIKDEKGLPHSERDAKTEAFLELYSLQSGLHSSSTEMVIEGPSRGIV